MLMEMANECKNAAWVRVAGLGAGARDRAQAALFRLELTLDEAPESAVVRISAADRYRLYVNGQSVVCGPRKGDQWNRYYETVDLARLLRPGRNALTARVVSYAFENTATTQNAPLSVFVSSVGPALMVEGEARLPGGKTLSLSTKDAAWTAAADDSFGLDSTGAFYVGATEKFFAAHCRDWRNGEALGLPAAQPYFGSGINDYGEFSPLQLKARAIPNLSEARMDFAAQLPNLEGEKGFAFDANGLAVVPAGATQAVELDAGVLRTAYLRLKTQGEGGHVRVTYAERYFPRNEGDPKGPMRRDDRENGKITGFFDEIFPSENESLFESFWYRTFRFVRIEVTAGAQPVRLWMPDFIQTAYPLEVKANLDFPQERMEKLWEISVRTLRSCMHETHEDCPYYEQLQYTLDTRLQMLFTYAISGDTRMAANVLWDYHNSRLPDGILQSRYPCTHTQVIPDFAIYWIFMLEEYYLQTGDAEPIAFYRSTMDGVLDFFGRHMGPQGLVEKLGYWEFGDWVDQWDGNTGTPDATYRGPAALHNLTYALGLRTAARLMRVVNREGLAEEYEARADHICARVHELCYDAARGLLREGPGFDQYSQHSQALGVLAGALTGEEARRAMRIAMEEKDILLCTFPWQYTLFRALEKTGLYDLTAPVWEQYFSMLDRHLTTVPERPGETRSDCHAWSALPLYEYPRLLLGVQPAAPGWAAIRVAPHAVGIDRLSGCVPTPKGDVQVQWQLKEGKMHVKVQGPDVPLTVEIDGTAYEACHGALDI